MKQSQLFTKTRREAPKDEVSKNAKLLIRAGFIHKEMAGVYSFLPLGLRVMNKIVGIIREEMNAIGGQELHMTALQEKTKWESTNRWDDAVVDNWFKTKLKNDTEVGLGFTHEEPLTSIMKDHIRSFRDLPVLAYQFQTKFRNEERAKSGIMRAREFLMKDLYSFSRDEKEHMELYEKAKQAYKKIFNRLGIGSETFVTFASGGSFSKFSHEFQTITDAGEDVIYVPTKSNHDGDTVAINKEVFTEDVLKDLGQSKDDFIEKKAVEVGNIFTLSTKFSGPLELMYSDEKGANLPVFMGSYGIGPGRVMGTIAEIKSDEKGLIWPESVSPFAVHLVAIFNEKNMSAKEEADKIYAEMSQKGIEVLYDDRDASAGEKLSDADLIGIPKRIIISEKTLKNGEAEVKYRDSGKVEMVKITDL